MRFGKGWALLRGVPVHRYSQRESAITYWGFGCEQAACVIIVFDSLRL